MTSSDYTQQIHIDASADRIFEVLSTPAEFAAWWAPATGSAAEGGGLQISFDGFDEPLVLQVREAARPHTVTWEVEACSFIPDWVGTTPAFTLSDDGTGGCDLTFQHQGLGSELECYEMCAAGWNQYLPSLRDYVATGTGNPYTVARLG